MEEAFDGSELLEVEGPGPPVTGFTPTIWVDGGSGCTSLCRSLLLCPYPGESGVTSSAKAGVPRPTTDAKRMGKTKALIEVESVMMEFSSLAAA
jgi:hypothetical protein